jgi:hypothetical protein
MGRRANARHARLLDQEEAAVVNTVNIAEGAGRVVQAVTRRCATRLHTGRRANARHARLLGREEAAVVNTVNIAEGAGRVVQAMAWMWAAWLCGSTWEGVLMRGTPGYLIKKRPRW